MLAGLLIVGYLLYFSNRALHTKIGELAEPNRELRLLNKVLLDLSSLQVLQRASRLPEQDSLDAAYFTLSRQILASIHQLEKIQPAFVKENPDLDSLATWLQALSQTLEKSRYLYRRLKQMDFNNKAYKIIQNQIEKIGETTPDSTLLAHDTLQRLVYDEWQTINKVVPLEDSLEEKQEEREDIPKKKMSRAERKAARAERRARRKAIKNGEVEQDTLTFVTREINVTMDSLEVWQKDTTLNEITEKLGLINQKENWQVQEIYQHEKKIYQLNSRILQKLEGVIKHLNQKASSQTIYKKEQSKKILNQYFWVSMGVALVLVLFAIGLAWGLLSDIDTHRFYEKQLFRAKQDAEKLARAKSDFLANMSHEIRTPLHAILGFSEQIEKENKDLRLRESIRIVHQSSQHLLKLVNEVLELSRLEAEALSLEEAPFSLWQVLELSHHTFWQQARDKQITFNLSPSEHSELVLNGDAFRLRQVLFNLVSNAIKFTDSGEVRISLFAQEKDDNTWELEIQVKDSGIGISDEQQKLIFDNFYQVDSRTLGRPAGSGLGLGISNKIVKAMGGSLEVESVLGQGSVFKIKLRLPVASQQVFKPISRPDGLPQKLKARNILVVDDDAINLKLARYLLQKFELPCEEAQHGKEALEILHSHGEQFDLALVDLHMPEVDGFELIPRIREILPQLPIIVLTANLVPEDLQRVLDSGGDALLLKPFQEEAFFQILSEHLPHKHSSPSSLPIEVMYDLETLKGFVLGDEALFQEIAEDMITQSSEDLVSMEVFVEEQNWKKIGEIAHRLYARFSQMHITPTSDKLRDLDIKTRDSRDLEGKEELHRLAQEIMLEGKVALNQLRSELMSLKTTD